jgi:hypothetical protein
LGSGGGGDISLHHHVWGSLNLLTKGTEGYFSASKGSRGDASQSLNLVTKLQKDWRYKRRARLIGDCSVNLSPLILYIYMIQN